MKSEYTAPTVTRIGSFRRLTKGFGHDTYDIYLIAGWNFFATEPSYDTTG